jgi:phosphoglycolate phosphatase-like HAD superfamily hydrolase
MAHNLNSKVSTVALDFDGVIANLDVDWKNAIKYGSKIVGHDIKSLLLFYEENFGTPLFQKVSLEVEKIELEALKHSSPVSHIADFLQKLSERNVDIYIVSMQSQRVIETFLSQQGLSRYFKEIVTREQYPTKEAQVQYVAKTASSKILFVDDSKRNIENCKGLGAVSFYFARNPKPKDAEKTWRKLLDLVK